MSAHGITTLGTIRGCALLALLACGEPNDPTTGSIEVKASTMGGGTDPNGYLVQLPSGPTPVTGPRVPSNGSVILTDLSPGDYLVRLDDITSTCTVDGANPLQVTVFTEQRTLAEFLVTCVAPPAPNDLVFAAVPPGTDGVPQDIFRVNANGGTARNLTESPDREELSPVWKPDGSKIAFLGGEFLVGPYLLSLMDPDGANTTDLGVDFTPYAWSPDGARLAGTVTGIDLHVINSDGTGLTNLTNRICLPGRECGIVEGASWSPDGTRIVYGISKIPTGPLPGCWVVSLNGTGPTLVKEPCYMPAWAPNSERIAFTGDGTELGHIMLMNPDGTGTVDLAPLYGADISDRAPSWSPDGSLIAFISRRGAEPADPNQIFIMHADGTELRQVPIVSPPPGIGRPTWGPAAP
jgi:Tol biopolymer transport system component